MTTTRAANGSDLNPRNMLSCNVCHDTLGATALHHMIGDSPDVFCGRCINKPVLHRRYFPDCLNANHIDAFDHPSKLHHRTRAAALVFINSRRTT